MEIADFDIALQPVNVLFSVTGIRRNEKYLDDPMFRPVKRVEGAKQDDSVPKYLIVPQRRRAELDETEASKLVLRIGGLSRAKAHLLSCRVYQESHRLSQQQTLGCRLTSDDRPREP